MSNRGSLANTQVISLRLDIRTVDILNALAREANLDTSQYLRKLLTRHCHYADIGNDLKRDVNQSVLYAQSAYEEIAILKERVNEIEEFIQKLLAAKKN